MGKRNMTDGELNRSADAGDILTAKKAAETLGISEATIRNWAKLGKLNPVSSSPLLFGKKTVDAMHKSLEKNEHLKSRRNKSRAAGNYIPLSYISSASDNHGAIRRLIEDLSEKTVTELSVLFYYAKELLSSRKVPTGLSDLTKAAPEGL